MLKAYQTDFKRILLWIHQYNIKIPYKPGPQLFITDRLSRQKHERKRDDKVLGMCTTINAIVMHGHTRLHNSKRDKNGNAR